MVLVLALVVAVAGGLWGWVQRAQRAQAAIETDLLRTVEPSGVPPSLALLALADYPAEQVWQAPVQQEEWDGALAMWLFGPAQPDRTSVDRLLTLAQAEARGAPDDAAALLLAAADVTRISPELTDRDRADLLVLLGIRMEELGLSASAVSEWRQAEILAHHSPTLQPHYRATLLQTLSTLYQQAGAGTLAVRAREAVAQVGTGGAPLVVPEMAPLEQAALPEQPAELRVARERRRVAALQAGVALNGGTAEGAYTELRDALVAERQLHEAWIAAQLSQEPPLAVRAELLLYQIEWLQRERMLALGFGGEAFADWRDRQVATEAELSATWDALEAVRIAQGLQDGNRERATLAHRDWWAARLVQARLARDPGALPETILASMRPNQADEAGGASLRLDWIAGRPWRLPREWVGRDLPE